MTLITKKSRSRKGNFWHTLKFKDRLIKIISVAKILCRRMCTEDPTIDAAINLIVALQLNFEAIRAEIALIMRIKLIAFAL